MTHTPLGNVATPSGVSELRAQAMSGDVEAYLKLCRLDADRGSWEHVTSIAHRNPGVLFWLECCLVSREIFDAPPRYSTYAYLFLDSSTLPGAWRACFRGSLVYMLKGVADQVHPIAHFSACIRSLEDYITGGSLQWALACIALPQIRDIFLRAFHPGSLCGTLCGTFSAYIASPTPRMAALSAIAYLDTLKDTPGVRPRMATLPPLRGC